jgi:hypothetical protein
MMISWGEGTFRIAEFIKLVRVNITLEVEYWPTLASGGTGYVDVNLSPYLRFRNSLWTGMILLAIS